MTIDLFRANVRHGHLSESQGTFVPPAGASPAVAGPVMAPALELAFDGAGRIHGIDAALCARLTVSCATGSCAAGTCASGSASLVGADLASLLAEPGRAAFCAWLASGQTGASLRLDLLQSDGPPAPFDALLLRLGPGQPGRAVLRDVLAPSAEIAGLRAECDRMAAFVDGTVLGTWVWNVQTGETIFNERWAGIIGYRLADLEPVSIKTWAALCHPEDLERSGRELERHFSGDSDWYEVEARMRHKDGRWVWIRDVGRLQSRTADGKPEWMCGVHRDIDALKVREARLRRAQELLERAGMLAGLGGWELDLRSGEVFWSDETCRIHGVAPGYSPSLAEAIAFYAPEAREEVNVAVAAAMQTGLPWDFELPLVQAGGARVWVRSVGRVSFEDGQPVRVSGAFQDISARKETEQRLAEAAETARRAGERLNTLADNAPGALFEHREDASGHVDLPYFSARLPELLGVSREAMLSDGTCAAANIHPEDAVALAAAIRHSREGLLPLFCTYRLNHPSRGLRWMQLSSLPFPQPDGAVIWRGNLFDVTEQSEAQGKLGETLEALRIAHERLNLIAENIPGGLFECRRGADGRTWFPYFTQRFSDLLGVPAQALHADAAAALRLVPPGDAARMQASFETSRREMSLLQTRQRVRRADGSLRWVEVLAQPFAQGEGVVTWFGNAVDITERLEIEARAAAAAEQVRLAHSRLNSIMEIAPVGLFEYRRNADGSSDFPYSIAGFDELVGFSRAQIDLLGGRLLDQVVDEDRLEMFASTEESATTLSPWRMRFRFDHPRRGLLWLSASSTPHAREDGSIVWTGAVYDASSDVEREAELERAYALAEQMRAENERMAFHDGLTGLPNRRAFDRRLDERLQAARSGTGAPDCALIQIDIDHFKHVNDTLGHAAGDQVLRRMAEVLRESLRPGDFAARLGGDEFSILLGAGSTGVAAESIVALLRNRLDIPFRYRGSPCRISASFGVVLVPDLTSLPEELQFYADAALYRAKEGGRDRVEVFAGDLTARLHDSRQMVGELHKALEAGQFVPWFQPQVSARDGRLVGVEVLVRWRHPSRGILAPDAFLKLAEQLRILPEIDRLMMERSAETLALWRAQGVVVPKISFNVSAGRVRDPGLLASAREIACRGTRVGLELVETICLEDQDRSFCEELERLRAAGLEIEVDDFGSGHTSIIGLMQVRPSALKIDRRLVQALQENAGAVELVSTIIQMARAMGIATIAEGVETQAQAKLLHSIGCDVLQGYLVAPPLEAEAFVAFVARCGAGAVVSL